MSLEEATTEIRHLRVIDYIVFAAMLAISALIGIYYACTGGKQKTASEFLMANRQMGVFPVALSLLASFVSAIALLGIPSEMYSYGTQYLLLTGSYAIVIFITGHVLLPIFYQMRLTSAYEYLERRFHKYNRLAGTITIILQMSMYMGIVLYAPALALNAVTGLSWTMSVLLLGAVCTFYTTIGGMKAVMWTDVFQTIVMFVGMLAVVILGLIEIGGWSNLWAALERGHRIEFFNFDPNMLNRHSFWSLIFGGTFTWLVIYGINQSQVQRYCATKTMRKAQLALWLNLPGLIAFLWLCALTGLIAYAYYESCDPLTIRTKITKSDQILPLFVMDVCSKIPGFAGLFISAVFSAAMSTVSSGVNSLAAITLEDIIKPYILRHCFPSVSKSGLSEERGAILSKALALSFGALAIALAFVASAMGNVLQAALGLFGMMGGPLLGVFLLGILFPWANWKGALAGHIFGGIASLWIGFGGFIYKYPQPRAPMFVHGCPANLTLNATDSLINAFEGEENARQSYEGLSIYRLSYMWQGAFAVFCTVAFGLIVSFITGHSTSKDVDPDLLFSFRSRWRRWKPSKHGGRAGVFVTELKPYDPLSCSAASSRTPLAYSSTMESGISNCAALSSDQIDKSVDNPIGSNTEESVYDVEIHKKPVFM